MATVTVDINGIDGTPSASILTLIGITLLSVAPALLLQTMLKMVMACSAVHRFCLLALLSEKTCAPMLAKSMLANQSKKQTNQ